MALLGRAVSNGVNPRHTVAWHTTQRTMSHGTAVWHTAQHHMTYSTIQNSASRVEPFEVALLSSFKNSLKVGVFRAIVLKKRLFFDKKKLTNRPTMQLVWGRNKDKNEINPNPFPFLFFHSSCCPQQRGC